MAYCSSSLSSSVSSASANKHRTHTHPKPARAPPNQRTRSRHANQRHADADARRESPQRPPKTSTLAACCPNLRRTLPAAANERVARESAREECALAGLASGRVAPLATSCEVVFGVAGPHAASPLVDGGGGSTRSIAIVWRRFGRIVWRVWKWESNGSGRGQPRGSSSRPGGRPTDRSFGGVRACVRVRVMGYRRPRAHTSRGGADRPDGRPKVLIDPTTTRITPQ